MSYRESENCPDIVCKLNQDFTPILFMCYNDLNKSLLLLSSLIDNNITRHDTNIYTSMLNIT